MDRRTVLAVALVALLCSSGVGAAAELPALQTGDVETDAVVLEAAVDEDGDARWSIEYRVELDDENTTEAFESLQADIEANESDYRSQFATRMRSTVGAAENATGREMAVENVSVEARTSPLSGEYGVVRYSFTWVGFAELSDDRIAAGDALAGLFLDSDTELTISWPEGYVADVVQPEPDREGDRSATWEGPREFGTGQPQVVIRSENAVPPWGILVGVLLFAGGGAVWYYRRRAAGRIAEADGQAGVGSPGTAGSGGRQESPESSADDGGARGVDAPAGTDEDPTTSAEGEPAAATSDPPTDLLSPQERVVQLLERNGGRMKQKDVTEQLDWSAARTSQVVSDLREEGTVESFRLGRENVLRFPDDD